MALPVHIVDGNGSSRHAQVTRHNSIRVSSSPALVSELALGEQNIRRVYREFFADPAGSKNLNVNAPVTGIKFSIGTSNIIVENEEPVHQVKLISKVRFLFESDNMDLSVSGDFRRFGSAAASPGLTNGLIFKINQGNIVTDLFAGVVQTTGDLFKTNSSFVNFTNAVSAITDFLSVDFDFDVPIVISDGSVDTLEITVRDDLSSLVSFQVIAMGHYEVISEI